MCHLFFGRSKDDASAIKDIIMESDIPRKTADCYASIAISYSKNPELPFYFGMYAHPNIIELQKAVNQEFENIKVRVIFSGEVKNKMSFFREGVKSIDDVRYNYVIFRVNLSNDYHKRAQFGLTIAIAQFIRAYCPEYIHYKNMPSEKNKITLDTINDAFNLTGYKYGAWAGGVQCSKDNLMLFDNVEMMNKIMKGLPIGRMPANSRLINCIKNNKVINEEEDFDDDFDEEDDEDDD